MIFLPIVWASPRMTSSSTRATSAAEEEFLLIRLPGLAEHLLPHHALPITHQPHQILGNILGISKLRDGFLNLRR